MSGAFVRRSSYQKIDVSFPCVCPVIDHKFHHNGAEDYFDNDKIHCQ